MSRPKKLFIGICASSNPNRIKTFLNINSIKHKIGTLPGFIKPFIKNEK